MKTILGTMTFSDQVDQQSAGSMIKAAKLAGVNELDTAFVYNKGKTETLLGQINQSAVLEGTFIAGKANPKAEQGLTPESVRLQLDTSLSRLNMTSFDLYYLHAPDLSVPIRDTLACINEQHQAGKFQRFGLSNYAAWQVAEIVEICRHEGWVTPSVYQGMYNALTRDIERELLPCLANYNICFYVYNPLAGGLLTGKHQSVDSLPNEGRFATFDGYQARYWKPEYFDVINQLSEQCRAQEIAPAAAALRWLTHHSALSQGNSKEDHGIILGASSIEHLQQNLQAMNDKPLPQILVDAFDTGWDEVRPACIKYFRP